MIKNPLKVGERRVYGSLEVVRFACPASLDPWRCYGVRGEHDGRLLFEDFHAEDEAVRFVLSLLLQELDR